MAVHKRTRPASHRPAKLGAVPAVARAMLVDLGMPVSANRYVRCDPTTWGAWTQRRTAAAWQLCCLHSGLAPEAFGPTGADGVRQLLSPLPRADREAGRLAWSAARGVPIAPEILFAHNLLRVEAAISAEELEVAISTSSCAPLLRSVGALKFWRWAERVSLARIGPWPLRPIADAHWDELLDWLPDRFIFDGTRAGSGVETFVSKADWNATCDAVNLCYRHWADQYQARVDRQGRSVIPTRQQISTFLKASGFDASDALVAVVSRLLTPADTRKGPRARHSRPDK